MMATLYFTTRLALPFGKQVFTVTLPALTHLSYNLIELLRSAIAQTQTQYCGFLPMHLVLVHLQELPAQAIAMKAVCSDFVLRLAIALNVKAVLC